MVLALNVVDGKEQFEAWRDTVVRYRQSNFTDPGYLDASDNGDFFDDG